MSEQGKEKKFSKEEQARIDEVRRKGEALSQYSEWMENYQNEEASKIETIVFDRLFRSMIAEMFLEHAYKKEDPADFIDSFFSTFKEVNNESLRVGFVERIPDSSKVENIMFASMFPSREKVQEEIDTSFDKAKEWYSRNIIRNFITETNGNKGKNK